MEAPFRRSQLLDGLDVRMPRVCFSRTSRDFYPAEIATQLLGEYQPVDVEG
jgi:hypothetical protein